MAEAFADLETRCPCTSSWPMAGRRQVQLPAGIRGRRRALRPLQLHRPAGAHAAARQRLRRRAPHRGGDRRPGGGSAGGNPLDFIAAYQKRFKVALRPGLPRFCGGLAGYFGYDAVRYIEKKLEATCPPDTLGTPDILLLQCEELAVIDNLSGKLYLIVYADPAQPEAYARARSACASSRTSCATRSARRRSSQRKLPGRAQLCQGRLPGGRGAGQGADRRRRLHAGAGGPAHPQALHRKPLSLYRALRSLNPAPTCTTTTLATSMWWAPARRSWCARSHGRGQKVTIRPLAGTRPRGATPEKDKAAEQELVNDPKERAEHVMLIDLARNDIGRIAKTGSVKVTEAFASSATAM
jgi:anthranilate synthase component 1